MLEKALFASAQLNSLRFRNRPFRIFLSNAIPQIFNELKALGPAQLKEPFEFRFHPSSKLVGFMGRFKTQSA
jgi:hypothetical protein